MVVGEGVEKRTAQAGLSNFLKRDFQVGKSYTHVPDFKTRLGSDHLRRVSSKATTKTTTASKVHLPRTESQKRRSAAKAAETCAKNKAAKAAQGQGGPSPNTTEPEERSAVPANPQPQVPVNPQAAQVPLMGAASSSPVVTDSDIGMLYQINSDSQIDPSLCAISAPSIQHPVPTNEPTSHMCSLTPPQRSPSMLSNYEDHDSTNQRNATPGSSHTARSAAPTGSSSTPSRCAHEKKPIPYQTYNSKESLGLDGATDKQRWLFLRDTIRGRLKAQNFQPGKSWTAHTLPQRAVVVTETQKILTQQAANDQKWVWVIRNASLMQVIEDIARDCCNDTNSYKMQKEKKYGTG